VKPAADLRIAPRFSSDADAIAYAEARGLYSRHKVYAFDSLWLPPQEHFGRFDFVHQGVFVYKVEPQGRIEIDPNFDGWVMCDVAKILECVHEPFTLVETL